MKARGLAFYLVVFQGGNAIGSAAMGLLAAHFGVTATLGGAAVALALSPLAVSRYRMPKIAAEDLVAATDVPVPQTAQANPEGRVMVSLEWIAAPGNEASLAAAVSALEAARRRTGGTSWRLWADAERPERMIEEFTVASWEDHLRQHERMTRRDLARVAAAAELAVGQPVDTHWIDARS